MARQDVPIIVIGAGLAGLVCARELLRAGRRVLVIEQQDSVGGRIRTDVTSDGFMLDRGFQVLFAAYPALLRQVRLASLEPRYFASDTLVAFEGRTERLGHPLYAPTSLLPSIRSGLASPMDIVALTRSTLRSLSLGDAPLRPVERTTHDEMRALGVSSRFYERVIAPFFGGTSLDRTLSSDAAFFGLVLRSMAIGRTFVPAHGVQRLPETIAHDIPTTSIQFGTRVDAIDTDDGRVRSVRTSSATFEAQAVVVATEAPEATRLTGATTPAGKRSCTTVYFTSERSLYEGPRLVLNGERTFVNHLVQMTNVAPEYAPPGRHLIAADIVGEVDEPDERVATLAADDIATWFSGARGIYLEPLRVVRVPYSQFAQPPGIYRHLPPSRTDVEGLFLGGEYLHSSSVQGAIRGGELAAQAVLSSL